MYKSSRSPEEAREQFWVPVNQRQECDGLFMFLYTFALWEGPNRTTSALLSALLTRCEHAAIAIVILTDQV